METITPDYLVVGAGAMGMAFADTIVSDSKATVALVDRYGQPGGHWLIAYPFVRLHQPSSYYGVNSKVLGNTEVDLVGYNKGLSTMAPGHEVCAYFTAVMHDTLLPSGRVEYYPKHEYQGDGQFKSLLTGKSYRVGENTKIVDATYMRVKVPAMGPPVYTVTDGVKIVPPNGLLNIDRPYSNYTIIGGGKTSIDSALWLLSNGISADLINWVIPRDMWMFLRGTMLEAGKFRDSNVANAMATAEAVMAATSIDDLLLRLEACDQIVRLDKTIMPTSWHCATVHTLELEQLLKIKSIIRKGRVTAIATDKVTLTDGEYTPKADTLYVDCSAYSIPKRPIVPVFNGKNLTLQPVRMCQQGFSAAFIAHVETTYNDDKTKNELTFPVPHPDHPEETARQRLQTYRNDLIWKQYPKTAAWVAASRLDLFGGLQPLIPEDPQAAEEMQKEMLALINGQIEKFEWLMKNFAAKENWTGLETDMADAKS